MPIDLNRNLVDATRAIAAAQKAQKKLAAVGVTAGEITAAKKQLQTVLGERKKHAAAAAAAHDESHDKHALLEEGTALVERARRVVHNVLRHDNPAAPSELAERGGVNANIKASAHLQQVAASLVDAAKDARWKKALAKRGFDAKLQKRLGEIVHALDGAAPFSLAEDPALTDDTRELFKRVSYLRDMALTAFGPHSSEYAQFRASPHRAKKVVAPAAAAPAA